MTELVEHTIPGQAITVRVYTRDFPGEGGAHHHYRLEPIAQDDPQGAINPLEIIFQNGPVLTRGVNGVTDEALLMVLIDRLRGFQSGPFSCKENSVALTDLEEALMWLNKRTRDRMRRGVEGKAEK